MLGYVFLSIFALLLLTACGDGLTGQAGGANPVTDAKSPDDRKTRQTTEDVDTLDTNTNSSPIIVNDLARLLSQTSSKSCRHCDLSGADLSGAYL